MPLILFSCFTRTEFCIGKVGEMGIKNLSHVGYIYCIENIYWCQRKKLQRREDWKILKSKWQTQSLWHEFVGHYWHCIGSSLTFKAVHNQYVSRATCLNLQNFTTCGLLKESALEPLLFTPYIVPLGLLFVISNAGFHLYADDTQIILVFLPVIYRCTLPYLERLSIILDTIHSWMTQNKLLLNPDKTQFLLLCY